MTVTATSVTDRRIDFNLISYCPLAFAITTLDDQPASHPMGCIDIAHRLALGPRQGISETFTWEPRYGIPVRPALATTYRAWGTLARRRLAEDGKETWLDEARSAPVILTVLGENGNAASRAGEVDSASHASMIILTEGSKSADADAITSRLEGKHGFQARHTSARGALIGILAELDPSQAAALAKEPDVGRVVKVGPPSPAPPGEAGNKFFRAAPGWAIPGLYEVVLVEEPLGVQFTAELRPPGWRDPDWKAKDEARVAAVRNAAESLIAVHGGRLVSVFAPAAAGFGCAMNESQALAMASDPRVRVVNEAVYGLDP